MQVNKSEKPNLSLIGKWLRFQLYESKEFRIWALQKILSDKRKFESKNNN